MNRTCYSMRRNRIIILISLLLCAAAPLARSQGATGFRFGQPYYSHLFIDTVYKNSDPYIPCQSVYDVRLAARLGFRYVEANLHATATPGKYLVIHGYRGALGYQIEDLDGNFAPEVVIAKTPFDTLRTKYRYRSSNPRYRTPISSLEEFLYECRSCGVAPVIQYVDECSLSIIKSIMGDDYILYCGRRDLGHKGMIMEYKTIASVEGVIEHCRWIGAPYMYCMGNVSDFSDEQLRQIVAGVHALGCNIGFAGCYETPQTSVRLFSLGFDFSASGWDINEIHCGNLCNLCIEPTIHLQPGQKLDTGKPELPSPFLSGASLRIAFKGTLHIRLGSHIDADFTSDGTNSIHLSSYFLNEQPDVQITAVSGTTISYFTFKASEF